MTDKMLHSLIHKVIPSLYALALLSACASSPAPIRLTDYSQTVLYNWNDNIPLNAIRLGAGNLSPFYIFIEGDGRAYIDRTTPSKNPTPLNPVALYLASQTATAQPSATVFYVARPCMWANTRASCTNSKLWTDWRFSSDIIELQSNFIQTLVADYKFKSAPIILVGYSGGAAIALDAALQLRAAGNPVEVITVAGNLDPNHTNTFHKVSTQPNWASPTYSALATIPQHHLIGGADKVIPRKLSEQYLQNLGSKCADVTLVPGATHGNGWNDAFATVLTQPFTCTPQVPETAASPNP